MTNPYQEYASNKVVTAEPRELVIMLYRGAVQFLEKASVEITSYTTYDKANTHIVRAQDIITELMLTLDIGKGGEIAQSLFSLYGFMKKELLTANLNKDPKPVKTVIRLLKNLQTAWEEIGKRK